MAKFIINQYSATGSAGPSVTETPIAGTLEGDLKPASRFKEVLVPVEKCRSLLIYNASASDTLLVSTRTGSDIFEPIPPLSGRYIKNERGGTVSIKVIGAK